MRDSWSCGHQSLTEGKTFASQRIIDTPAGRREARRYPPTLTAFRMTDAARWIRSNEPESVSRSPRYNRM